MLNSADLQQVIFINTLGMSVLMHTLRTASYMFLTSNHSGRAISPTGKTRKQAAECLAFVQGTGLELLLVRHQIDYDADRIRECFFNFLGKREYFD